MRDKSSVLNGIPDPGTIRTQLSIALQEVDVLRRMLRVSERAHRYRKTNEAARRQPVQGRSGHDAPE